MNKVRLLKAGENKDTTSQLDFHINTNIFRQIDNIQRENKIAFVGPSYFNHVRNINHESEDRRAVVSFLIEIIENGFEINTDLLRQASKEYNIPYDDLYWNISHYVVRDKTVEWMCQHSNIPVEVYGTHWELNKIVRPYYNGNIEYKENLAEIYNSAKYVLITHPFQINSQQLGEVIACRSIPVLYDCRHSGEPPHCDEALLYFKTANDLRIIIEQQLGKPVADFGKDFNFTTMKELRINMMAGRKNS